MPDLAQTAVVPANVVFRSFVNETVVLNLTTGRYHGLNTVAGKVLELIAADGNLESVAQRLARAYEQPLERIRVDVASFVADLEERGLVEVAPAAT